MQSISGARLVLVILLLCSWFLLPSAVHAAPSENPVPGLSSLDTNYVYAGSGDVTLTLDGWNFVAGSIARWGGLDLATTILSPFQLTALVPAAQVASAGTVSITVFSSEPGGGASNPLSFTIRPLDVWLSIGLSGQTVNTVAADPRNPLVLYTGTYTGIYKSTDGGSTWAASNTGLGSMLVQALAIHPHLPGTLYAGTSYGLFKSTNYGANWSWVNGYNFDVRDLVFDPADPATFYAATWGSGVIKYTNNGASFDFTNYSVVRYVHSLAVDPTNPLIMNAGTGGTYYGLFNTVNGGASWNWATTYVGNRLAAHPTTPNLVYAASNAGVLYSPNGGYTWNPLYTSNSALAIAIDPLTPENIYAGLASNVIRSTNGGPNWSILPGFSGLNVLRLAFNPSQPADVYAATNGGVFRLHTNNPLPALTSLSPSSVPAGSPATTLTLNGMKFVRGAVVKWNGVPLATTYLSGGQLTASIPVENLTTMQDASITVTNPAPGGGASNALTFAITKHPLTLASIQPAFATIGDTSLELNLVGIGFTPASLARWDSMDLTTTYISPTLLTATLPAANLSVAGVYNLTVSNPEPGGEVSTALPFSVNNPRPTLTALNPPNVLFNSSTFTLTLFGEQFTTGAQANWDDQALPTTYISPNQLEAVISASLLLAGGSFSIHVSNPTPSIGPSDPLIFNVYDPAPPTLDQLGPNYNFIGEPAINLAVNGTNILDGSTLLWDGVPLAVISGRTAPIPASSLAATGTFTLSLQNPAPVEGESNGLPFSVHPTSQWFVKGQGNGNYLLVDPEQPSTLYLASGSVILRSTDRGSHWLETSSGLPGSTVYRIAYASAGATYPSTFYASTEGGVYKSTNHGASWTSASTGMSALSVREIAVHPTDSQHLVAVVYGKGVYISLDGAASWSLVSLPEMTNADAVVIDPFNPDIIYVGTFAARVYKSPDGGFTWNLMYGGCNTYSMAISRHTPGLVLVGTNCGAQLTRNGGLTWTTMTSGISDAVAFDPVQAGVMYASERVGKLWRSRDNGLTWQSISNGLNSGEIVTNVAVNPLSPGVLYASGALASYAMKLPTPQSSLSAISPTQGTLGDPNLDLQVSGAGFTPEAVIRLTWPDASWQDLVTTYVSSTLLTAVRPLATLNTGGTVNISVVYTNPGSGLSNSLPFLVNYPIPTLVSLSPDGQLVGRSAFTLTVDGLGFARSSLVQWEGTSLVTTWISPTRLSATVPASDLLTVNSYAITVLNPAPGGGESNALPFEVRNLIPELTSMDPVSASIGSSGFTLTLSGVDFIPESVVRWEGAALATTYISPTQLTAAIPAAQLASAGTFSVTVTSPASGGGTSKAHTFTVYNLAPTLSSLSPASVHVSAAGLIITITGTNFLPGTIARWEGIDLVTTYVSPTQLTASLPASLFLQVGVFNLVGENPFPSLRPSQPLPFTVRPWQLFLPSLFR